MAAISLSSWVFIKWRAAGKRKACSDIWVLSWAQNKRQSEKISVLILLVDIFHHIAQA